MRIPRTDTDCPSRSRFKGEVLRSRILSAMLACLCACAPSRPSAPETPQASSNAFTDGSRSTTAPAPRDSQPPIDLDTLEVVSSATTIYMWGGLYADPALDAPVPLASGVLHPGDALTLVRVHCRVQGVGTAAKVRCSAAGRTPTPPAGQSWHDRARACTELRTRTPSMRQILAVRQYLDRTLQPAEATSPTAGAVHMIQDLGRVTPPVVDAKGPTLLEVVFTFSWQGPETRTGGCEDVDPSMQGCDPFTIKTGRTVTHTRTTVRYAYSGAPEQELSGLFLGRAPELHGALIGHRNVQGYVQLHPRLQVGGSTNGPDAYYRDQLGAYVDFETAADHSPQVRAAITLNRAILALRLRDLNMLRREVDALRSMANRADVDGAALRLDASLAVFDRVLTGAWLLEDPCASAD